jgi:carboxylesterase type B
MAQARRHAVTIHAMTRSRKGLFHKAATQSGNHGGRLTAVMSYLMEIQTMKLATKFKCKSIDKDEMVACLMKVPPEAFVSAQEAEEFAFVPVIDGHLLPGDQHQLIDEGNYETKFPFLMGSIQRLGMAALLTASIGSRFPI